MASHDDQEPSEARGNAAGGRLLERDAVLAALGDLLDGAAASRGSSLFLVGAAGIGKTALLDWLEPVAGAAGFTVARAVASPMESALPFGLTGQAFRGLGGDEIEDALEPDRHTGRASRFFRTLRWLEKLSAPCPLAVLLDDLHWSDTDSLDMVGFVCRRIGGLRVALVGTLRPDPDRATELAADLSSSRSARIVHLDPLSPRASAELLERLVDQPLAEDVREQLWRACAGTPLLLEAAAAAVRDGRRPPSLGTGQQLRASFLLERFAGIGDVARAYVDAAAILGIRFRPADAALLAGVGEGMLAPAHARLLRAGLVEDLEPGWARFVHPLFAQALLDAQSGPERARLHAEAFALLVARGAPDAVAAEHAVAAGLTGDLAAVDVVWRAGRAAMGEGALEAASVHLGNALALAGDRAVDGLRLDHLRALVARARTEEVRQACTAMLRRRDLDATTRAQVLRLLARAAAVDGRSREVEQLYESAAAALEEPEPGVAAELLLDGAITGLVASPVHWVARVSARALELAPESSANRELLEFLRAYAALLGGRVDELQALEATVSLAGLRPPGGDLGWAWTVAVHLLNALKSMERFDDAAALFEREFARAVAAGAPVLMHALAIAYADALHRLGRVEEALDLVVDTMKMTERPMSPWSDLAMAVLLTELGRDGEAEAHLQAMRIFLEGVPPDCNAPVRLWTGLIGARSLLAAGDGAGASSLMDEVARTAVLTGFLEPCIVPWAGVAVTAHLAAGRRASAEAVLDELETMGARLPCRWPRAAVALGRAQVAAEDALHAKRARPGGDGALGQVGDLFLSALARFEELALPVAHAEALLCHGRFLRRAGRMVQARQQLALALSLADRSGSLRVARLAGAELAAAGGRRRRRDDDPQRLTAQEERVAALASEGLTNAQIGQALYLSPKTVEHHLGKVFAKLGLASRRQLMMAWPQRPADPPLVHLHDGGIP